jgi:hypothetical protein
MEQAMLMNGRQPGGTPAQILGGITLACGVFCAIPPTSIVGAMLWIGDLGDILASCIGRPPFMPILVGCYLGLIVWAGLWLRDRKLRALMPPRR